MSVSTETRRQSSGPGALLKAVIENPDAHLPRFRYAESGEVSDPAEAKLIRYQVTLSTNCEPRGDQRVTRRMLSVYVDHLLANDPLRPDWLSDEEYFQRNRGMVELVGLDAESFPERAQSLFAKAPILHLNISCRDRLNISSFLSVLRGQGQLSRIRSLDLSHCGLDDDQAEALASSGLTGLRWLSLASNSITRTGVAALASAPVLESLDFLSLRGNPCDPGERFTYDQGEVADYLEPKEGVELRREFPRSAWLNRVRRQLDGSRVLTASLGDDPPDRFHIEKVDEDVMTVLRYCHKTYDDFQTEVSAVH